MVTWTHTDDGLVVAERDRGTPMGALGAAQALACPAPVTPDQGPSASASRARGVIAGPATAGEGAEGNRPDERRRHARHAVTLEVTVRLGERAVKVQTRDLSVSGVCLDGDLGLAQGTTLEIELTLPGARESFPLQAVVRWVDKGRAAGVQFSAPRAFHVWAIQRYLTAVG